MRKYRTPPGARGRSGRRFWTQEELDYLARHYPDRLTIDIARELGRPMPSVYMHARLLGLKKSAGFFRTLGGRIQPGEADPRGGKTRFPKSHVPWNKGMKGWKACATRATPWT